MVHRALVTVSWLCCGLVIASFTLFAIDQMAGASKHQQKELAANLPATTTGIEPAARRHGQPRRFIDAAAADLTAPFSSFVQSSSAWVTHGVQTTLALVAYGLGLGYLARFSRGVG